MTGYSRYAIYAPAPDDRFHEFGSQLLGYDAFSGNELPFPHGVVHEFTDWRDLIQDPRTYGFQATLKAPFSLASDQTKIELYTACDEFANGAAYTCDRSNRRQYRGIHRGDPIGVLR